MTAVAAGPTFVFLYGPPAAGKLTIARELAKLTGFRVFDNTTSIEWALPFFDFGTAEFWRLVMKFRFTVWEEAARAGLDLIMTFVYATSDDTALVDQTMAIAPTHGGRNGIVRLLCPAEVLMERIDAPDRIERRKLSTKEGFRQSLQQYDFFQPLPGHEGLEIDTSAVKPQAAAAKIASYYDLPVVGNTAG